MYSQHFRSQKSGHKNRGYKNGDGLYSQQGQYANICLLNRPRIADLKYFMIKFHPQKVPKPLCEWSQLRKYRWFLYVYLWTDAYRGRARFRFRLCSGIKQSLSQYDLLGLECQYRYVLSQSRYELCASDLQSQYRSDFLRFCVVRS